MVVASHGGLCRELLFTAEMILGPAAQTAAAPLATGVSLQDFAAQLRQAVAAVQQEAGVLLLADLAGGTPCNVAAVLAVQSEGLRVVAGVNLPMLLEVLSRREGVSLEELSGIAATAGQGGICRVSTGN
ncbi:PTS sugar transporter subunit IIA [Anaeromusa sp.]|uniref:PTS sugar transporter subunit IIA n=1 Tax=Anaeromusa sp. TaxID=1872520 RepID=UPI002606C22B|nr:PTS sugar transporter subunit IIA [Anaeromusa sp.]MDD3158608.1 PTS sugar transporter subunit IIA [Anaeromusa sp.]